MKWPGLPSLSIIPEARAAAWGGGCVTLFSFECCRSFIKCLTYAEGGELVVYIQHVPDGAAHGADDPINYVHHAVRGHLVTVDDPGTVDGHDLRSEDIFQTLQGTIWELEVFSF